MNPYDQDRLDALLYGSPQILPPRWRCTAYWYTVQSELPVSMCFLMELGSRAARMARQAGIGPVRVAEGPFWVNTWEPWLWDAAAATMEPYRTAWEYATNGRMMTGDDSDMDFIRAMVSYAGYLAGRLSVPLRLAKHGPPEVAEAYPDWIWSRVTEAMADSAAVGGDWHLDDDSLDGLLHGGASPALVPLAADPEHPHGYWAAGDY